MGMYFPNSQAGLLSRLGALQQWTRRDVRDGAGLGLWLRRAANLCVATLALWVIATNAVERWRVARDEQAMGRAAKTNHSVNDHTPLPIADDRPFASQYVAAPFFSVYAFRRLTPGMTEAEVRDRIGYPLRRSAVGIKSVAWIYTLPEQNAMPYPHFSVLFDVRSGQLLRTNAIPLVYNSSSDCDVWSVRADINPPRFAVLRQLNKSFVPPLGYAAILVAGAASEIEVAASALHQRLSRLGLPESPIITCVADGDNSSHPLRRRGPQLIIVCEEGFFALPTPEQNETRAACEADVNWALVRLLGGASRSSDDGPLHLPDHIVQR